LRDASAHIGVIGQWLGVPTWDPFLEHSHHFFVCRHGDPEVHGGIRSPEPVCPAPNKGKEVIGGEQAGLLRHFALVQNQRVTAGGAHAEGVPHPFHAASFCL